MTAALCTACGNLKFGAWLPCKSCGTSSTGNQSLDIFFSNHYLDREALAFLGTVIARIRRVAPEPETGHRLFLYFVSKNLPGLMKLEVDAAQRSELESLLKTAAVPVVPANLVFRFDTPIAKRRKPWWKFW